MITNQDIRDRVNINETRTTDDGWGVQVSVETEASAIGYPQEYIAGRVTLIHTAKFQARSGHTTPAIDGCVRNIHHMLYGDLRGELHLLLGLVQYGSRDEVYSKLHDILRKLEE